MCLLSYVCILLLLGSQVETTPTQFADPSVYVWNISNNGELVRLEGFSAPPLHRPTHCADYATIQQQVCLPNTYQQMSSAWLIYTTELKCTSELLFWEVKFLSCVKMLHSLNVLLTNILQNQTFGWCSCCSSSNSLMQKQDYTEAEINIFAVHWFFSTSCKFLTSGGV